MEPYTEEKAAAYLAKQTALDPDIENFEGWLAFAIELPAESRVIGEVGMYLRPHPKNEGDIGWSLHPAYQHHGYATEAARALLAHAFQTRNLHRVTAGCDSRNTASWRLMERLGMRREAHFRQSHYADSAWHDEYTYALLADEWSALDNPT